MTSFPASARRFARISRGQLMSVNPAANKTKAPVATKPGM